MNIDPGVLRSASLSSKDVRVGEAGIALPDDLVAGDAGILVLAPLDIAGRRTTFW